MTPVCRPRLARTPPINRDFDALLYHLQLLFQFASLLGLGPSFFQAAAAAKAKQAEGICFAPVSLDKERARERESRDR